MRSYIVAQIYRMTDMIDTNNPPQYLTRDELLYEKHFVTVNNNQIVDSVILTLV